MPKIYETTRKPADLPKVPEPQPLRVQGIGFAPPRDGATVARQQGQMPKILTPIYSDRLFLCLRRRWTRLT